MIKKKITRIAFLLLAAVAVFALSFIGARVGLTSSRTAAESDDLPQRLQVSPCRGMMKSA